MAIPRMQIPRFWRLRNQRLRLEGSNCGGCGKLHYPPRLVCPDCGEGGAHKAETVNPTPLVPEGFRASVGGKERGG